MAFRFLTAGESHGQALSATLEGLPAGIPISADAIAIDLGRRQRGYGRGARMTIEQDRAEILAGVRHGRTIGSPVLLVVRNRDWENWTQVMQVEALSDEDAAELAALADDGNKRAQAVDPRAAGSRRSGRRAEVRLRRRARCARARERARDDRARRRRRRVSGLPGRAGHRRLELHRRGRWRGRRSGGCVPVASARPRPARCAVPTPTPKCA